VSVSLAHAMENLKMSKKKVNSRWSKGRERYSSERKIERTRWVKDRHNKWKLETESVSEPVYCIEQAHTFKDGFYRGAKLGNHYPRVFASSDRVSNLSSNIRLTRYYMRAKYHAHEKDKTLNATQYAMYSGRYYGLMHGLGAHMTKAVA
jgi:hypothetical protein